ncbi:MAG: hypothetical protein Q9188_005608 [Gyalolechia gomerana]
MGGEANEVGRCELNPPETSHGAVIEDPNEQPANRSGEDDVPEGSVEAQAGPSTEDIKGLTSRDLLSRIISNGPPRQVFQPASLQRSEEEPAGLDLPSFEFEFGGSLRASVRDLISRMIGAIRKAYEGRIKAEVEAEWGQIVRKWLQGQEHDQKRALAADFDAQYRHQWEIQNVPKMQKQLANRAEVSYHKSREIREEEAEKRWTEKDYPYFWDIKKKEMSKKIEADLRRELQKGVIATLRAEHMERLREEARLQITHEMMERMREQARQEIIDDKARYHHNMLLTQGEISKPPADVAPGVIRNVFFNIHHPGAGARSETGNFLQPTRMPDRILHHSNQIESSRRAGSMFQSDERPLTLPPSLEPSLFDCHPYTPPSGIDAMLPPPIPRGMVPSDRNRTSGTNPVEQAGIESPLETSSSQAQQNPPKTPEAKLRASEKSCSKQLKDRIPGARIPSPIRDNDLGAFLQTIDRAERVGPGPAIQPDNISEVDNQSREDARNGPGQRLVAVLQIRAAFTQKAGKKRPSPAEDEAADEDSGEYKDDRRAGPKKPLTKRPRLEPTIRSQRRSTRIQAVMQSAATDAARARANASTMTAAAPAQSSATQPSQTGDNTGRKPIARSGRLKRNRDVQEAEIKEDKASPPPTKRTRRATAKINAAHTSNGTFTVAAAAASGPIAVDVNQAKRKPGRPRKTNGKAAPAAAKQINLRRVTPPPQISEKTPEALECPSANQAAQASGGEPLDNDNEETSSVPEDKGKGREVLDPSANLRSESPVREDTAENRMWDSLAAEGRASGAFHRPTRSSNVNDPFSSSIRCREDSFLALADAELSAREQEKDEGERKGQAEVIDLEDDETEEGL